jgi:hypothetical protein
MGRVSAGGLDRRGKTALYTRNGEAVTDRYAPIAKALEAIGPDAQGRDAVLSVSHRSDGPEQRGYASAIPALALIVVNS